MPLIVLEMLSRPMFTMRCGRIPLLVIAVLAFHLYLIRVWLSRHDWPYGGVATGALLDVSEAAQNETLGFEKIYYISLPQYGTAILLQITVSKIANLACLRSRTDRQDMMSLLAASTNIKLALQPGVFHLVQKSLANPHNPIISGISNLGPVGKWSQCQRQGETERE